MFLVTFYSFKGGVGRTTALLHVAWLLARREGKKVLICDLDLEAPGFIHQPFMKDLEPKKGFVDLVVDYIRSAELPKIQDGYVVPSKMGFDVLPSGGIADPDYAAKLSGIDWGRLEEDYYGAVLVKHLRDEFAAAGYDYVLVDSKTGFSDVGGICTLQLPDVVVLVFGLNEQNLAGIAGIHALIAEHNRQGGKHDIRVVPLASPYWPFSSEVLDGRMKLAAERLGIETKDISTVSYDTALAFQEAIVFDLEFAKGSQAARDYEQLCQRVRLFNPNDELYVEHHLVDCLERYRSRAWLFEPTSTMADAKPANVRREELAGRILDLGGRRVGFRKDDTDRCLLFLAIAAEVDSIDAGRARLKAIVERDPNHVAAHLIMAVDLDMRGMKVEARAAFDSAVERFPNSALAYRWSAMCWAWQKEFARAAEHAGKACGLDKSDADAWYLWGVALGELAKATGDKDLRREECGRYERAVQIKPDLHEAWHNWGVALGKLSEATGDQELAREACRKFERAVEIKPDKHEAWCNWGVALRQLSKATGDHELAREACRKYERAVQIKPDLHEAWSNWGVALGELAEATGNQELHREACRKYERAVQIKPDKHEAWYNWGVALGQLAEATGNQELHREACRKFERAVEIKPDMHQAWSNWGVVLGELAQRTADQDLLREACRKYERAVQIKPDLHEAWSNWSVALIKLHGMTHDSALLAEAREKCLQAEKIQEGAGAYNLACVESIAGDAEKSLDWLRKALAHKPNLATQAETDDDLERVRQDPRFKEIVDSAKSSHSR